MEKTLKYILSDVKIKHANVLDILDCHTDSPVYADVMAEYPEVESNFYSLVKPETRILFDEIPSEIADENLPAGTKVVYLIHTIGGAVSAYCTQMFQEYDYLKGMLIDAMSSSFLFEMDKRIQDVLKKECGQRGVGISRRLEAPRDLSMLAQKVSCDKLFGEDHAPVKITSAYMLDPVKTNSTIYILTKNAKMFHTELDCSKCQAEHCFMRRSSQPNITVIQKNGTRSIPCTEDESILDTLRRHGMYSSAACGGTGKCGKCKVRFSEGVTAPAYADRLHFSPEDLEAGMRLACQAFPAADCTISLDLPDESAYEILTENAHTDSSALDFTEESYAIAIDIGTTTIAAALVGLTNKRPLNYYTTLNRQRMYGADVISRMLASMDGKKSLLQNSIREDILLCVVKLVEANKIDKKRLRKVILAGNTTMGHLLMGYPCNTLGVSPFTPVSLKEETHPFGEILENDYLTCPVILFPGISTFVGGDIVSGMLASGFASEKKIALFIDLGTNGEMAVGNKDRILTTSTAAGPAFEGGNILWGIGSVQGAISGVSIEGTKVKTETIGNKQPVGICGTGIIEVVSELLKNEMIDETGLLTDQYFETGFPIAQTQSGESIVVTQRDIREIQLAKSAVRAGIEVLLKRYGADYGDVDSVWLAGGFGVKIDQEKAMQIGMIPLELGDRIHAVGNSSLSGAIQYCLDENESEKIGQIVDNSLEISLSNDKDFNQLYVDYMFF